jgi:hypothetical protein
MASKPKKPAEPVLASKSGTLPATPSFPALTYAEFATFGRENIEAAVKTNAALSAGIEALGQEVMVYARSALQNASETARSLLGAKTLEDVVRLQADLAKRNLDGLIAGSVKLSELGVSLASEAMAPWEGRVEAAMVHLTYPQVSKSHAA